MTNQRIPYLVAILITVATAFGAGMVALRLPLWFDEISTVRVAEAPSIAGIWKASIEGFDFTPPLGFVAVQISQSMFGKSELSARLPFLMAGLLCMIVLFSIQATKKDPWAGVWAMIFFVNSYAGTYFYEARAYSFVLLGTVLAWYFWDSVEDKGSWRYLRYPLLSLSLSFALLSHMWAIIVPICFLAAIFLEWYRSKSVNFWEVLAIGLSYWPVVLYLPIIKASKSVNFSNPIYRASLAGTIEELVGKLALLCMLLLIAWLSFEALAPRAGERKLEVPATRDRQNGLLVALVAVPFVIYLVTSITGAAHMVRYSLPFTVGISVLIARKFSPIFQRGSRGAQAFLVLLAFAFTEQKPLNYGLDLMMNSSGQESAAAESYTDFLRKQSGPIVFAGGIAFLQSVYYADDALRSRMFFVAEPDLAVKHTGTNGLDRPMLVGQDYYKIRENLIRWNDLESMKNPFWVVTAIDHPMQWLDREMAARGFRFEVPYQFQKNLMLVYPPGYKQ